MEAAATITLKQDEIKRILTDYIIEQGYDIQNLKLKVSYLGQRQEEENIVAIANLEIKPRTRRENNE